MEHPLILINGGIPRSGTVLVGRILTALCQANRLGVARLNISEPRETPALARYIREHQGPEVLLVHVHVTSDEVMAALAARDDTRIFWNVRDPRDAMVSLKQLHDLELDRAIWAMDKFLEFAEAASSQATILKYEAMVGDPPGFVRFLAERTGLSCSPSQVDDIVQQTSPEAHRKIMERLRPGAEGSRTLETMTRTLIEDEATLINDRHIQSGAAGRWKAELTPEEQTRVTEAMWRWVDRLDYPRAGE
ncbi:MAG: sulfotransferase domain-containing protein [Pseudomonadota bacterium]